jgi:hypothetical protein
MTMTSDRGGAVGADDAPPTMVEVPRSHPARWAVGCIVFLHVLGAVVTVEAYQSSYQPLRPSGSWMTDVSPALGRQPVGLRLVNDFAGAPGDLYLPQQRGTFTLTASIENDGRFAVTIEAIALSGPGETPPWPLVVAGPPAYLPYSSLERSRPAPVAGLSLAPGGSILIALPTRMAYRCFINAGWTGTDAVWVKERFLTTTNWYPVALELPIVLREPQPVGTPGAICR